MLDKFEELIEAVAFAGEWAERVTGDDSIAELICAKKELRANIAQLEARITELEQENARLSEKLHDEMSQLEIATDLGNKRWIALNDIYENGERHNTNWCKRKSQKGLGLNGS
jgi:predicted nuclease with TOPRIM domain